MSAEGIVRIVYGAEAARRTLLVRKPLDEYAPSPELAQSIEHLFGEPLTPDQVVARILDDVAREGDAAVLRYSALLDGAKETTLCVPPERIEQAWEATPANIREALELSAARIAAFYERQPHQSWMDWDESGAAWARSSVRWTGWASMPRTAALPTPLRS